MLDAARADLELIGQLSSGPPDPIAVHDRNVVRRAVEYYTRSLTIFRDIGDREGQTWALNGLGEAAATAGSPAVALTHHTAALSVATDIGAAHQRARAHTGLGHAYERLANPVQARHHLERALSLHIDLESPEVDRLRGRLGALTRHDRRRGRCRR